VASGRCAGGIESSCFESIRLPVETVDDMYHSQTKQSDQDGSAGRHIAAIPVAAGPDTVICEAPDVKSALTSNRSATMKSECTM